MKSANAELIKTICFAKLAILQVYSVQIYFKSKYSEKL